MFGNKKFRKLCEKAGHNFEWIKKCKVKHGVDGWFDIPGCNVNSPGHLFKCSICGEKRKVKIKDLNFLQRQEIADKISCDLGFIVIPEKENWKLR